MSDDRSDDCPISQLSNHKFFYHSPALTSLRILRLIKSRLSALMWLM
jgi:hypothetical protein